MIASKHLCLRLFVMRIGKRAANDVIYRIVYGVVFPTVNTMSKPIWTDFNNFGKCGTKQLYIKEITFANASKTIIGIYEDLTKGHSLHEAFESAGCNIEELDFDVKYTQAAFETPWLVEQAKEKQISYIREICMLNPLSLFEIDGRIPNDATEALSKLESILKSITHLPFGCEYDHIGNLLITSTPDRDEYGHPLVKCSFQQGNKGNLTIEIDNKLHKNATSFYANVRLSISGKTILDSIFTQKCPTNGNITYNIPYSGNLSSAEIKIWKETNDNTLLIHCANYHFIQQINFEISLYGQKYKVESDWLKKIRSDIPEKSKNKTDELGDVVHKVTEHHTIKESGDYKWTERKKHSKPMQLSEDEFFPKGWNKESDTHGQLSFLNWFYDKAQNAKRIFLQDPYFEDVGLFFLAKSGTSAEITILTQTHLKTNSDGSSSEVPQDSLATREDNIKKMINQYPSLFAPLDLVIKDMPTKNNVLHDRYLFFFYDDEAITGFNLSNSLQGASTKQPLLITQIKEPALSKVVDHIEAICNEHETTTLYNCRERIDDKVSTNAEIADTDFYNILYTYCKEKDTSENDYCNIITNIFDNNTFARISTAGYCLARTPDCETEQIIVSVTPLIKANKNWIDQLKKFILDGYNEEYPIGYKKCPVCGFRHYDPTVLLDMDYANIVSSINCQLIEHSCCEHSSHRVWGQYYACRLLAKASGQDTIEVLKALNTSLQTIKADKTAYPVHKVTDILVSCIFENLTFGSGDKYIELLLSDSEQWCRGIGALMLMYKAQQKNIFSEISLITDQKEKTIFCMAALGCKPDIHDKSLIYKELVNIWNTTTDIDDILENSNKFLLDSHFLEDKADFVTNVIVPLIAKNRISKDKVENSFIEHLFTPSLNDKTAITLQNVLPKCLSILDANLSEIKTKSEQIICIFDKNIKSMIVKSEDDIFECARSAINLRNLLIAILNEYKGITRPDVAQLQAVFVTLDSLLDNAGLEETKKLFEYERFL